MNTKVRRTNIENLLFFDIETARRNETLDIDSKEFELFEWSLRDRVTGDVPEASVVIDTYNKQAALKPEFNRVVCVTVGFCKDGIAYLKTFKGSQKEILVGYYNLLKSTNLVPTGYNIINFDVPVLRLKALEEDVTFDIPDKLSDSQKKPWGLDGYLDLFEIVKGTYYHGISLDNACYLAGVASPKEGSISGPEVSNAFYRGEIAQIIEYCERDIVATMKLFLKLSGSNYEIKEIVVRGEEPKENQKPLLDSIFAKGQIDPEDYDRVMATAKTLDAEEKKKFCDLITAALLNKDKKTLDIDEQEIIDEILKS